MPLVLLGLLVLRPGERLSPLQRNAMFGAALVVTMVLIVGLRPMEVRFFDDIPRGPVAPPYLTLRANCGSLFWPSNTGFDPCRFARGTEAFFVAGIGGAGLATVAGASFLLRHRPGRSEPPL